jgi:dihydrofolate reductase
MRKLIVNEFMSLDGVVQSPGSADEDPSGGFKNGGWHMKYVDDVTREWVVRTVTGAGGFLLGRRTYEIFAGYWPKAPKEEQVLADPLNSRPKYVASRRHKGPLSWQNSKVLEGDAADAVAALKREEGGDLVVFGSSDFVHTLVERQLVDEFRLMIVPVVLGGGKRLFRDDGVLRSLRLVYGQPTTTGAFLATYAAPEPQLQIPVEGLHDQRRQPTTRA